MAVAVGNFAGNSFLPEKSKRARRPERAAKGLANARKADFEGRRTVFVVAFCAQNG